MRYDEKVTQNQTKRHNKRLVLRTIFETAETSRADVARETGLTRATVSSAVAELMEEGLVAELGLAPSGGGKPPTKLHVQPDGRHLIGVDLSSDILQASIYNLQGQAVRRASLPLTAANGDEALTHVYQLLDQLIEQAHAPLLGIGLGTPGVIDAERGVIHTAVNLNWHDLPLRDLLQTRYHLPIHIVNDSQAAALAEYTYGYGRQESDLAVVKAGRGISAGLILDGQLYHGRLRSGASEIGHVRIVEEYGEICTCGRVGCLETVASNRAILHMARHIAQTNPQSTLYAFRHNLDALDLAAVWQAYQVGDTTLYPITHQVGRALGRAITHLVASLNLPLVVLAGDVVHMGAPLQQLIQEEVHGRLLPTLAAQTRLELSHIGPENVLLGAAALLLTHELGVV